MDTLGDYRIIKTLGKNCFANVYLAEHKLMKKMFALKVLAKELVDDPEFVAQFEEDVHTLCQLDHPSIVKIHNISFANGHYFLVMDPILDESNEVIDLDKYLDLQEDILSETEIESILLQVASALDYAHHYKHNTNASNKTWIHGGLKLTNILVQKQERTIKIFLTDFGIMQLLGIGRCLLQAYSDAAKSLCISKTSTHYKHYRSYIRNFYFLAPEQKTSLINACDYRLDAYAFGVLSYYLLTKQFPEGIVQPIAKLAPDFLLNWDLVLRCFLDNNPENRPTHIEKTMREFLHKKQEKDLLQEKATSVMFAWTEIEKKVEDQMQMSFAFDRNIGQKKPKNTTASSALLRPLIKPSKITRPTSTKDPAAVFQMDLSVSRYTPRKIELESVAPLSSEMVVISEGTYFRGSNVGARDEMPRHVIAIDGFAMDIHPVTNEQFIRFLLVMGGEKEENNHDIIGFRESRIKKNAGKYTIEQGYQKHPVVGVTWYGACAYAKWLGKRLPTEAEWEVAGSGGKESGVYPTGDTIEKNQANFFSSDTTPVMSYPPGFFGLYDMAGQVYEWCANLYDAKEYSYCLENAKIPSTPKVPKNPQGPSQGVCRALRGGCWKSLKEDLRYSHRNKNNPGAINRTYGFRCAADLH